MRRFSILLLLFAGCSEATAAWHHHWDTAVSAVAAVFSAPYTEPDHGVADGACANASATAHWDLAEASGNITDECNSKVLVASGAPTYSVAGPFGAGNAITFLGATNDQFEAASDDDAFDIGTNDYVIQFWMKSSASTSVDGVIGKWTSNVGWYLYSRASFGSIAGAVGTSGGTVSDTSCDPGDITDGQWHHVYYAVDRDSAPGSSCQIDGIEISNPDYTARQESADNASTVVLGNIYSGYGGTFDGTLADMQFCTGATAISDCPNLFDDGLADVYGATPTFVRATDVEGIYPGEGAVAKRYSGVPNISATIDNDRTFPLSDDPVGIHLASAATYTALHNEDMSNAAWTAVGSSVVNVNDATLDPGGLTRADELVDDDAGVDEYIYQDVTIATTNNVQYQACVWVLCEDGPHTASIRVDLLGGGTPITGTTKTFTCTTDWQYRCHDEGNATLAIQNNASGNNVQRLVLNPTDETAASTGAMLVWRPSTYAGYTEKHDWIATTSSTVTVNADTLSYDVTSLGVDETGGTLCGWVSLQWLTGNQYVALHESTGVTAVGFLRSSRSGNNFYIDSGWGSIIAPPAYDADGLVSSCSGTPQTCDGSFVWTHHCMTWDADEVNTYLNGALVDQEAGSLTSGLTIDELRVGGDSAAGFSTHPNVTVSRVKLWTSMLDAAAVQAEYDANSAAYARAPINPGWMYAEAPPKPAWSSKEVAGW